MSLVRVRTTGVMTASIPGIAGRDARLEPGLRAAARFQSTFSHLTQSFHPIAKHRAVRPAVFRLGQVSQAAAALATRQTGAAMIKLFGSVVIGMKITTAISPWLLAASVTSVIVSPDVWSQETTEQDSTRLPTVTLTAKEAYQIEQNAAKSVGSYCQARRRGRTTGEAIDFVYSRTKFLPGIPQTTQRDAIKAYLTSGIVRCPAVRSGDQSALMNLSCTSLTQRQLSQIAQGKFVKTWGGDCLMIFNGNR